MKEQLKSLLQAKAEEKYQVNPECPANILSTHILSKEWQKEGFIAGGEFMYNEIIEHPSQYLDVGCRWMKADEFFGNGQELPDVVIVMFGNGRVFAYDTKHNLKGLQEVVMHHLHDMYCIGINKDLSENTTSKEMDELKKPLNELLDYHVNQRIRLENENERLKGLIKDLHSSGVEAALMLAGYNTNHAKELQQEAYKQYRENNNL